jgi:hypothetical protein
MPKFTVRVELHGASITAYPILHDAMGKAGFSQTIKGANGRVFALPQAEYNFVGDTSIKDVLSKARQVAAQTGREFEILVTQVAEHRRWYALSELTEEDEE